MESNTHQNTIAPMENQKQSKRNFTIELQEGEDYIVGGRLLSKTGVRKGRTPSKSEGGNRTRNWNAQPQKKGEP